MQFRRYGKRIHCIVTAYNKARKRSRQATILTLSEDYDGVVTPDMVELTGPEVPGFVNEINLYLARWREEKSQIAVIEAMKDLEKSASVVAELLRSRPEDFTERHRKTLTVVRERLSLTVPTRPAAVPSAPAPAGKKPKNAFGQELVDRARELKSGGLSAAAVAEQITAETGQKISKSWVQKVTTSGAG